ncbi:uncharacterized protein LOC120148673 [Hibiscus syriacus]|uniref:uncharacterized protein LOC120148673 n=1 Tax=Hibiscus syriacus TaxID=106335 RepID=UPI001921B8CA|nr:uncharacterized protein LOC120148673 [Hibiscus syriacus]
MELPFDEFEVIMGMDWLYHYYANLDYRLKRVQLTSLEGLEVSVASERMHPLTNVISVMSAQKLMRVTGNKLEDISIVQDFPDVFSDDLSGLPPDRKVEFQIEVMSGSTPILMAPYKMAPTELKKLKA